MVFRVPLKRYTPTGLVRIKKCTRFFLWSYLEIHVHMKVETLASAPPFEPVKVDGFVWHVLSGKKLSYLDMKFLKVLEEPWDEVAD